MNVSFRTFFLCLIPAVLFVTVSALTGVSAFGLPDLSTPIGAALLDVRLCRIATGFVVGAGLASSGCVLQTVLRNALAEPYILGVSGGGALGAALVIATGLSVLSPFALPAGAFVMAALTLAGVYLMTYGSVERSSQTLILNGVVVGSMLSSLLMMVLSFSKVQAVHSITWWLLGNLQATSWSMVAVVAVLVLLSLVLLCLESRSLDALCLGQEHAQYLGVPLKRVIPVVLLCATLSAAAAVAVSGIIGFVGLIVPHAVRRIVGHRHGVLLPYVALLGGTFVVVCDWLARLLFMPREIPVGVVTSLLGGPFFFYLLVHAKRRARASESGGTL